MNSPASQPRDRTRHLRHEHARRGHYRAESSPSIRHSAASAARPIRWESCARRQPLVLGAVRAFELQSPYAPPSFFALSGISHLMQLTRFQPVVLGTAARARASPRQQAMASHLHDLPPSPYSLQRCVQRTASPRRSTLFALDVLGPLQLPESVRREDSR